MSADEGSSEPGATDQNPVAGWKEAMKKSPGTAATVIGGAVLGAGLLFGFTEVALGVGAGYIAYRIWKKRGQTK